VAAFAATGAEQRCAGTAALALLLVGVKGALVAAIAGIQRAILMCQSLLRARRP